jgi:hypothetical protein
VARAKSIFERHETAESKIVPPAKKDIGTAWTIADDRVF